MPDTRRMTLVATSPAQRAARRARPTVAILAGLAVLVVLALLLLPIGATLTSIMGLALLTLVAIIVVARWRTGSTRLEPGAFPTLHTVAVASAVLVGGAAGRYFSSLLLAPLLGPTEPPTTTLLWALPTAIVMAAFLVWAARPIRPRGPRGPRA